MTSPTGPWFDVPYRDFFITIARRQYRHPRGTNPLRSFGFVGNIMFEYVALTDAPQEKVHGRTFYMSDLHAVRVRDWASAIQAEMGLAPLREVPVWTLAAVAKLGDLTQRAGLNWPPITTFLDPPRGDLHAILALAVGDGVFGHVTHIGDVHHVDDVIAEQLERAAQHVGIEERPKVADVRVVVDGGAAGVERHSPAGGIERREDLLALRERVVEAKAHRVTRDAGDRSVRLTLTTPNPVV